MTTAQQRFDEDYLYIRRELVRGRNPFVTVQSMKDWLATRVDGVVAQTIKDRDARLQRNVKAHPDREVEWLQEDGKRGGGKEDDE